MGLFFIAFSVLFFFTLALRKNLLLSSAVSLSAVVILGMLTGTVKASILLQACFHGLLVATEISLLVLGALAFYNNLKAGGFIQSLEKPLGLFSTNKLVIVILLAFYFGGFIEGVSGFGTPAMIIAPILLGLRFSPYLAASLSLLANTIPVVFGAVGTPVKIGFAELPATQVPLYATLLLVLPALFMSFAFKRILESDGLQDIHSNTGRVFFINIMAGAAFVIPFVFFSFFNPELPSILASVIGMLIWLLAVKSSGDSIARINRPLVKQLYKTFKPYLLIALLLITGKAILGNMQFTVLWPDIELRKGVNFFQPGLIFLTGLLLLSLLNTKQTVSLKSIFKETMQRLPVTFGCIVCLAIMARLLSSNLHVLELFNAGGIPAPLAPLLAVTTGFAGSFIAGSATISNLMFGAEWHSIGEHHGLNTSLLLASQLAGAAIGNALSIQNIAMVQAVLNTKGLERDIIRTLWKPLLIFFLFISITAVLLGIAAW